MSRLHGSLAFLLTVLLVTPSSWCEDGTNALERLIGLISPLDLPTGFKEVRRSASARYPHASIRYEAADGEVIMARVQIMPAATLQEWLRESMHALRHPRHGLRLLGLGDGAYAHRTSNVSKAHALKGAWRLTVHVEKGRRPGAEATRLAEQLIRKMFARFTGQQPPRTQVPEIRPVEENRPPRITGFWHTPADPTYDDEVQVSVRFKDPERRAVTVRWWYPQGATRQTQAFTVPPGTETHTFTLPGKPDRRLMEILVFVEDDSGHKVNQTRGIQVEAPYARVTAATGQVVPERRIRRLAQIRTMNLYAGDVLHFGSGHQRGLGSSTTDIEWPEWGVRGRYIFNPIRYGSQDSWSKVTIGPPAPEAGLMAGMQFLFSYVVGEGIDKGTKFVLRGDPLRVGGALGAFEYMSRSAGGSGMVYVRLKSLVVIQGEDDGGLGFYTYEGRPELITPDGKTIVVPAAHRTWIRGSGLIDEPTRFDPVDKPDLPPATSTGTKAGGVVEVEQLTVQRDVARADGRGLLVHVPLRVQGRKDVPTQVYAFFDDQNGVPLKDGNQRYHNLAGQVCSILTVKPGYDDTRWEPPLELFLPYAELHLPPGQHEIQVHVEIYDPATRRDLHVTPKKRIKVRSGDALGEARLKSLRLVHNQVRAGEKGLDIRFELELDRRLGRKTTVAAYFQFQSGQALRDLDGRFFDEKGYVATQLDFVPEYTAARWTEPRIFLSYAQLHLQPGLHRLRVFLRVLDPTTGTTLAQSDWANFEVTQGD